MDAPTSPLAGDREVIEQSGLFDAEWYLQQCPDVATGDIDPIAHYLTQGAALGLSPGPAFSTSRYLAAHVDVAAAGMNPLVHYVRHGQREGRMVFPAADPPSTARHLPRHEGRTRVLVVGHLAGRRLFGAERSLLDVLDGFATIGIDTVVIAPMTDNEAYLDELRARCTALESMRVPYRYPHEPADEHAVQQVMAIIERYGIQAVHTNTIVPREPLLAARRLGLPAVVHAREIPFDDPELCEWLQATPDELVASVVADADFLIANSHATASVYPMPGRVAVVPNIADLAKFPPAPPHTGPVRVALVANWQAKKGRNEFFELARRFAGRDDCEFVMVGPTDEQQHELAASVDVPPNVRFTGYAAGPTAAMAEADVVVSLSRCHEAAPRTMLEAMASGLPVVAWARGGAVEQIADGTTGYLVPFDDLDRLFDCIDELVRSPTTRAAMGRAGRQRISAQFSPAQLARALAEAYQAILPTEEPG